MIQFLKPARYVAAVLLATACLLPTACGDGTPKPGAPGKAAKAYLTYAYERNYDAFANAMVFASDSVEPGRHAANVRAVKEILDEKGDEFYVSIDSVKQINVLSEVLDESGLRAEVMLETVCRNGLRDTTAYELVKREDSWKIYQEK